MTALTTALLAIVIVGYVLYRQTVQRMVTRRDLVVPAILGLYLAGRYVDWSNATEAALIVGDACAGLAIGAASGLMIRVWRDEAGRVYQQGSWRYAAVLLGLIAARIALRVLLAGDHAVSPSLLNEAFIAAALGTYLGRTLSIGARALALVGWQPAGLPRKRVRGGGAWR